MRLTKIYVSKLFGIFDHIIPLRVAERITIIHGPNGFGKTAILQMLQGLLANQWAVLRRVPFQTFCVSFDNGAELEVTKKLKADGEDESQSRFVLHFQFREKDKKPQDFALDTLASKERIGMPLEYIEHRIDGLKRIGPDTWLHLPSGRRLDLDDVLDAYGDYLPHVSPPARKRRKLPEWMSELPKQFEVRLIEAQRLMNVSDSRRNVQSETQYGYEPAVALYSRELASKIQEKQAAYGTFSQRLDSTFPTRVLQRHASLSATAEELTNKLGELEQKRQRVIAAGLLTKEAHAVSIAAPQQPVDESTKGILALYAEDAESKLSVFDEIADRIELFKELVNKRFKYKQIDVERQSGFQLRSTTGSQLFPTDLSSGEQHELVLLYELLFKTKANALILIDEPELSLHVAWQVDFLDDLERVIKLSSFDVLLATHSPQIINNRWDLTVELQSKE